MRQVLLATAALLAALAESIHPAHAGPFCMSTALSGGGSDCRYWTWAECRINLPGVGDYCFTNTVAGYVFDGRDPANPRVIGREPRYKPRPWR